MKINTDFHIQEAAGLKDRNTDGKVNGAGSFSNLLEQLSTTDGASDVQMTGLMPEASPLFQSTVQSAEQADAMSTGEQALELLEHLGVLLTKTDNDGTGIGPVASALESSISELLDRRDSLDVQDPLRGAIDEIGVLSVVASMKIDRGDFSV